MPQRSYRDPRFRGEKTYGSLDEKNTAAGSVQSRHTGVTQSFAAASGASPEQLRFPRDPARDNMTFPRGAAASGSARAGNAEKAEKASGYHTMSFRMTPARMREPGRRYIGDVEGTVYIPSQAVRLKNGRLAGGSYARKTWAKRMTAVRTPRMHTVTSKEHKPFPFLVILSAMLCTFLFMTILYNNVQITQKQKTLNSLQAKQAVLDDTLDGLELELEQKDDFRAVEERALELGMVKSDQLIKEYVHIESKDYIENIEEEKETWEFVLTDAFDRVYRKIKSWIEYFR